MMAAKKPKAEPNRDPIAFTITLDGWSAERFVQQWMHHVEERVGEYVDTKFHEAVEKHLDIAITEAVTELTKERVAAVVDEVIREGWTRTDEYGRATGKRTVRDFVLEWLNPRDSYRAPLPALVEEVMKRELGQNGELKQILADAKAKLREMVDGRIADQLRTVVSSAIGKKE